MRTYLILLLLMGAIAPTGCVPGALDKSDVQPQTAPATAALTPSPTVAITPSPTIDIAVSDLTIRPGENLGEWMVIGFIENQSNQQLSNITIQVSLQDHAGTQISQQIMPIFLSRIGPGETSPFLARFEVENAEQVSRASAKIMTYQTTPFIKTNVTAEIFSIASSQGGGLAILGGVKNLQGRHIILERLGLLAVGAEDQVIDFATTAIGLSTIGPDEEAPFLVLMPRDPGAVTFVPILDAAPLLDLLQYKIAILEPPRVLPTEQRAPLVIGTIRNEDDVPRWASALLTLKLEGEIIAITSLNSPLPLQPGEARAYGETEFPGLQAQLTSRQSQISDLTAEILIDPLASRPSERDLVPLDLEITSFELIGSSLFLKGDITNRAQTEVEGVTILAAVYSTEGDLLTAGWSIVTDRLSMGDSIHFVLPLPLPQGTNLAMVEYDLQAAGLTP